VGGESSDLPSDLHRGKEPLVYLLVRRLGRPQIRSGVCREDKLPPLPEIETPFPASPVRSLLNVVTSLLVLVLQRLQREAAVSFIHIYHIIFSGKYPSSVFWNITSCSLRYRGTHRFHHQGCTIIHARNQHEAVSKQSRCLAKNSGLYRNPCSHAYNRSQHA
jgi:hypothetical protein